MMVTDGWWFNCKGIILSNRDWGWSQNSNPLRKNQHWRWQMLEDRGNRLQVLGFSGVVFVAKPSKGPGIGKRQCFAPSVPSVWRKKCVSFLNGQMSNTKTIFTRLNGKYGQCKVGDVVEKRRKHHARSICIEKCHERGTSAPWIFRVWHEESANYTKMT